MSFRAVWIFVSLLAINTAIFFLFLKLGERVFHLNTSNIFWFFLTTFAAISFTSTILVYSIVTYFLDKFSSIDRVSKETLHELSTPIATIKANCEMLSKGISDTKNLDRLQRISNASDRLLELYEELEWTIKNDSGIQPKTKIMVDEMIEAIIDGFEEKLKAKNVTITYDLEPELISIDYFGFKKSITNLVDNAIKYAYTNSNVEIIWKKREFIIKNMGEEIKPEELMAVFDRYYRGETKQKGFGIGLHALKSFCDKNNISIKINSQNKITTVELGFTKF